MKLADGNGKLLPFSTNLTTALLQCPAYYRECFAIYSAVQYFRYILEAQHRAIYTDHKLITYAFLQHRKKLPPVQLNQLSFVEQFTTDIQHTALTLTVLSPTSSLVSLQLHHPDLLFPLLNDAKFVVFCMD
ncbi:uncharacterized protein TNCT_199741 [Trichonephila clavata]|uniref:Reverse transcriptase RNase H-like domain-containing protein n=1 Tax=Trichonephila clavata TaxID=2740835 RepID=A0A8X6IGM8_TRICU|nr:uncharacterized protein TNCT_199741 [Trichonephila clavata]